MYHKFGWKVHTWQANRFLKKVLFDCVSWVLAWTSGIDRIWPLIKQGIEVEFSKPRYIQRNFRKPLKYLEQKLDHLPKQPQKKLLLFLSRNSRPKEHPHRNTFFWLTWKHICFYIDKPFIGIVPNSYSCLTTQKTHIPKWQAVFMYGRTDFLGNLSRILLYVKTLQEL